MSASVLVANARHRFNQSESKKYLKEKYTNMLTVAYAGGMFAVDRTLIAFVVATDSDIITDIYGNPVKINRDEFIKFATTTYNAVMSIWLEEYNNLSNKR